ncbi:hypothetical protein [Pseudoalteromonas sp. TAB23]|uniref:hypothetical protein n=1 Tax=Pseudoalteromonas sp. TAB23 TaxID=1938595 RepID=UPI0004642ACF|nr:hypothetical protein [Pseudoalteromonas sp. TAB23]
MDFGEEVLFLLNVSKTEVETYLDANFGHLYELGQCQYFSYETNDENEANINELRALGKPVPLDLLFISRARTEIGKCALTGQTGKCRVIVLIE